MTATAVILAAGSGDRMQIKTNKILLSIGGQPLICHAVRTFAQVAGIDEIVLVVNPNEAKTIMTLLQPLHQGILFVEGGATRRDSALAGVQAASGDIVLIHDGARPFLTRALIRNVLAEAKREKAVIPVLPIADFVHRLVPGSHCITDMHDSGGPLACAQTPQGFERRLILQCLAAAPPNIRDDASAVLLSGFKVHTIVGERTNIKITRNNDLPLAEAIAANLTSQESGFSLC